MKVIEQDRYYFITCNGHLYMKRLHMQEHTSIYCAKELAKTYSGKNIYGEFNERLFEVRYFDALKCPIVFKCKSTIKKTKDK